MALTDEIKDASSFVREIKDTAKTNKDDILKVVYAIRDIAESLRQLAYGDQTRIEATLTNWREVNELLIAKESAEQELGKTVGPDWNKIGDGIAKVAGVAAKVAIAIIAV